jgi:tellurite resistance protein TerC
MAAWWLWVGFSLLLAILLFIDLGVLNRHAHVISAREALKQASVWISIALIFNVLLGVLYQHHIGGLGLYEQPSLAQSPPPGDSAASPAKPELTPSLETKPTTAESERADKPLVDGKLSATFGLPSSGVEAGTMFLLCYLLELTLSFDNMLVIALIMGFFRVPAQYQHRVLFWGIVGAIVMRGTMVIAGAIAIQQFTWMIYVFGVLLIASAVKMLMMEDDGHADFSSNIVVRTAKKLFRVAERYDGPNFFTRVPVDAQGRMVEPAVPTEHHEPSAPSTPVETHPARTGWAITPLFLTLLVIESADVIFAVDSIPAAFGVSIDPYIVFTSNMFAILGLRAMYFALAAALDRFQHLKLAMIFVLLLIGVKMIATRALDVHINPITSLGVVVGMLFLGVMASLKRMKKPPEGLTADLADIAEIGLIRAKRIVLVGIGLIVLLAGILMTVPGMPGPGLLVIPIGLAILSAEFAWAKYLQKKYLESAAAAGKKAGDTFIKKPRPWLIPTVVMGTMAIALAGHYYFHPSAEHEFFYEKRNMIIIGFLVGSLIGQALWAWETMARYNRAIAEKGLQETHRARPPIWLGILLLVVAAGGTLALYVYGPGEASRAWHIGGLVMAGLVGSLIWMTLSRQAERALSVEHLRTTHGAQHQS